MLPGVGRLTGVSIDIACSSLARPHLSQGDTGDLADLASAGAGRLDGITIVQLRTSYARHRLFRSWDAMD
jgi:hypothetical protein